MAEVAIHNRTCPPIFLCTTSCPVHYVYNIRHIIAPFTLRTKQLTTHSIITASNVALGALPEIQPSPNAATVKPVGGAHPLFEHTALVERSHRAKLCIGAITASSRCATVAVRHLLYYYGGHHTHKHIHSSSFGEQLLLRSCGRTEEREGECAQTQQQRQQCRATSTRCTFPSVWPNGHMA